jgi:O-methyltransferase
MKEAVAMSPQLLSSPEIWIERLERRINWLDTVINKNDERSISERSQNTYFEFLKNYVSGVCYGEEEKSVLPSKDVQKTPLIVDQRKAGNDWTYLGDTMTGFKRLDSLQGLLKDVIQNGIAGDFIETGVWRGGSSIFARGVIRGLGQQDRKTFVCDSFAGLPPGERGLDKGDKGWDHWPYLEVSAEVVAGNFNSAGVLDENVIFAKGFFNDTIPVLSNMVDSLAIMRLDGDIYESTVDVLYHLYEKLSVGGYVIMDDWFGFPSKTACEDFFKVHGISPEIIAVDNLSAYWKKTENITVQFWRYEQNQFKQE